MGPAGKAPTERFSDRAALYVRYRPGYPEQVIEILRRETGLTPAAHIADLGCGTGISAELFLRCGASVTGVEPNPEMRAFAAALASKYPRWRLVAASAEATTLPDRSVDTVVAAQAFHWFDPQRFRAECARILRRGGWVVLLWNTRRTEASPFLRAYEALLQHYATDYREVDHRRIDAAALQRFFGHPAFERRRLDHRQQFDRDALRGRLLSSSYAPAAGHPSHAPMMAALDRLFEQHQEGGQVGFEYDTELYFGRLE